MDIVTLALAKKYSNRLFSKVDSVSISFVDELPVSPAEKTIYFVPRNESEFDYVYNEYMRSGDGGGRLYGKCTNANSVSIELCDCLDNAGYKQSLAVRMLVKYIKSECPNAKTIVRHWDVNGKHCPAPMIGKNNLKWKHLKNFINGKRVFIAKVTETAYVRKKPTVNSDSVLTLEKGAKIKVIGEKGKWGKVKVKGIVRYVNLTKITFSK